MRVITVPCLTDNYAYLVVDDASGVAAVVDPSDYEPVEAALEREGVALAEIWLTHHHFDHVGGVEALVASHPSAAVLGSAYDFAHARIPGQTRGLSDGEQFAFAGHDVSVIAIPGHTLGAIAFVVDEHLFSGDMLFLAGCGRVFEGTMEQMTASLDKLRRLPPGTKVWCGHEYTENNLRFATTVDPDNPHIRAAAEAAKNARAAGRPTVPGLLSTELRVNPFLRWDAPELAKTQESVASFTALRRRKDAFQ